MSNPVVFVADEYTFFEKSITVYFFEKKYHSKPFSKKVSQYTFFWKSTSVVTNLPHFLFQKLSEECSEPSFAPKFWGVRVLGGVYLVEFPFQSPFRPPSWYTGFQNAWSGRLATKVENPKPARSDIVAPCFIFIVKACHGTLKIQKTGEEVHFKDVLQQRASYCMVQI